MPRTASSASNAPAAAASQRPALKPAKMPIPPSDRRRPLVPAVGRGQRDEPPCERSAEQGPDRDRGSRQCGDRRDGAHRREGNGTPLARCWDAALPSGRRKADREHGSSRFAGVGGPARGGGRRAPYAGAPGAGEARWGTRGLRAAARENRSGDAVSPMRGRRRGHRRGATPRRTGTQLPRFRRKGHLAQAVPWFRLPRVGGGSGSDLAGPWLGRPGSGSGGAARERRRSIRRGRREGPARGCIHCAGWRSTPTSSATASCSRTSSAAISRPSTAARCSGSPGRSSTRSRSWRSTSSSSACSGKAHDDRPLPAVPARRHRLLDLLRRRRCRRRARSLIDSAELIKKVRFPRQLVAVLGRRHAARHLRRDARDPDRALTRLRAGVARRRSGSRSRLQPLFVALVAGIALLVACAERASSATSSTSSTAAAPAVVLPDADPLELRAAAGERAVPSDAARPPALGRTSSPRRSTPCATRSGSATPHAWPTRSTSLVAAAVALALGSARLPPDRRPDRDRALTGPGSYDADRRPAPRRARSARRRATAPRPARRTRAGRRRPAAARARRPASTDGQSSGCGKFGIRPGPGRVGASARGRRRPRPPCQSIAPATTA